MLAVLSTTAKRQIQALESCQQRWMGGQLGAQPCVSTCQWLIYSLWPCRAELKAEQQAVEKMLFIFARIFLNRNAG